jgi:hypothetical protein
VYLHHKANLPLGPKLFLKNRKKKFLVVLWEEKKPKNENNEKSKLHSGGQIFLNI